MLRVAAILDSVLQNGYPADRLEVLVADGMSTDGTRDLLAAYTAQDSRVRVIDTIEAFRKGFDYAGTLQDVIRA